MERSTSVIVAVDVHYEGDTARIGIVGFSAWTDAAPLFVRMVEDSAPYDDYVPGEFYRRELPALLGALRDNADVDTVVVDGYVRLAPDRPGLGWRLYETLGSQIRVVGVAKNHFKGAHAIEVLRGGSRKPLFITAAGVAPTVAAGAVAAMAGSHRMPTLLQLADRASRGLELGSQTP